MLLNRNVWPKVILSVVLCELAGILGAIFTVSGVREWYPHLIKPAWTPPSAVFAPVWTILYAMMGVAVGLIWARGLSSSREKRAFVWFWAQVVLTVLWSAVFFGLRAPSGGYAVILVLWLTIAATLWLFSKISSTSAWLLVPYFLWVTFASTLNFTIMAFNVIKPLTNRMDIDPANGKPDYTGREVPKPE